MSKYNKRKRKLQEQKGYSYPFLKETNPKGNITFKESNTYWHSGSGYVTCLFVTGFPQNGLGYFWAKEVMSIRDTISFMHVMELDNREVKDALVKSISEKGSRIGQGRTAVDEQTELDEYSELTNMERIVRKYNASVKGIQIRIYVSGGTPEKLAYEVERVKNEVSRFELTTFLGEQELEYHAPFIPAHRLRDTPNARHPQPLLVSALGASFWGDHTKLEDPYGAYFGSTPTGGVFNFDLLTRNTFRKRPNMIISGSANMGQKKFFVKNADTLYARGNRLFNIDLDNTFCRSNEGSEGLPRINEYQHGIRIDMSGVNSKYVLNIMQVLPTVTKENGVEVDEKSSFSNHIDAMVAIAQASSPELAPVVLRHLKTLIREFYIEKKYWYINPDDHINDPDFGITDLVETEYPVLSDFIMYLSSRRQGYINNNKHDEVSWTDDLVATFRDLKERYPFFEGYTTFEDFSKESVVTFDLSGITDSNLMNLQLIQAFRIIQMYVVANGKLENIKYERDLSNNIHKDRAQYTHSIINISNADRVIEERNTQAIKYLADVTGTISRNFGAMVIEMGSLQNLLVANNDGVGEFSNAVRRLFEVIQYRLFAQTEESAISKIASTLGSLRESELQTLPRLAQDTFLMNISGGANIVFGQEFCDWEEERYRYLETL